MKLDTADNYTRVLADIDSIVKAKDLLKGADVEINALSDIFYMVGNEVRLSILYILNEEKEFCVCDLADVLGMTIPAVSQHLRKLKQANLVDFTKKGSSIYYFISANHKAIVRTILSFIEIKKSRILEAYN